MSYVFHHLLTSYICLSVCLSVCLPVCLPACLSVCLSVCVSVCLSCCLSVFLSVCLSVCLCVCLSVCLHYVRIEKVAISAALPLATLHVCQCLGPSVLPVVRGFNHTQTKIFCRFNRDVIFTLFYIIYMLACFRHASHNLIKRSVFFVRYIYYTIKLTFFTSLTYPSAQT